MTTTQVDRNPNPVQSTTDMLAMQATTPAMQHSIALSRNAKGEPSWDVKIYFADNDYAGGIVSAVRAIDLELQSVFRPDWMGKRS